MSYTPESLVACPNLQSKLTQVFNANPAKFTTEPIALTEYLMSPVNRNGIAQLVNPGRGKIKTVELTYQPRILKGSSTADASLTCTATTERGNTSETYTIDETSSLKQEQLFSTDSLARMCEDNADFFNEQIMMMVAALDVDVNVKNATQLEALVGNWSTRAASVPFATVNGSDQLELRTVVSSGSYSPMVQSPYSLDQAAKVSNFGNYAVIGGMLWNGYVELNRSGCCTATGLNVGDIQSRFGSVSMYDPDVVTALGGDAYSFVLANGAAQVLTYNRWDGLFATQVPTESHGIIRSPWTGLPYDLTVKYDCGNIHVVLFAITKVVSLPADMYQTGDHLEGVNGVAVMKVNNA